MDMNEKLSFACDYAKGAHPGILRRMTRSLNPPETGSGKPAGAKMLLWSSL